LSGMARSLGVVAANADVALVRTRAAAPAATMSLLNFLIPPNIGQLVAETMMLSSYERVA
jgi:hypothetical protein